MTKPVKQRIVEYLSISGPASDAKIRDALGLVHQQVNQACRQLTRDGKIHRTKGDDGIIQNRPSVRSGQNTDATPLRAQVKSREMTPITEDEIKEAVKQYLEERGWRVDIAWGRDRGIDIQAFAGNNRLILEAKGEAPTPQQEGNYFLGAVGELVQRTADPEGTYGLALPDNARYRGLVARLPSLARERVLHVVLFVSRFEEGLLVTVDGNEELVSVLD